MVRQVSWLAVLLYVSCLAHGGETHALPRSTPEDQGVSSTKLLNWVDAIDRQADSLHSFMLLRHGKVVAEGWWSPYNADSPQMLFSLSKSFTSTAVGLAVAEGKLSVSDPVLKFFPDDTPAEVSKNLEAMRVRDLLIMSTGHHADDLQQFKFSSDENLPRVFLSLPVAHKPGTHFLYNTAATFMQSAIVQKVTGEKVVDYLQPRLFDPLGIAPPRWSETKQGISHGGFGLNLRTEDIAKFGQLLLQNGNWNGRQLIPRAWIEAATRAQTSNGSNPDSDWDQGYGYQFWRCRHGFYRGDGAFGQYCIVMPQYDAVVVMTGATGDMGKVMQLTWDLLLPAFDTATDDPAAHASLQSRLASLMLALPKGELTSQSADSIGGQTYTFDQNDMTVEAITPTFAATGDSLVLRVGGKDHTIAVGRGKWQVGRSDLAVTLAPAGAINAVDPIEQPIAAAGAWNEGVYTVSVAFYETPVVMQLSLTPEDGGLVLAEISYNVAFGPTTRPVLTGRRRSS